MLTKEVLAPRPSPPRDLRDLRPIDMEARARTKLMWVIGITCGLSGLGYVLQKLLELWQ